MIDPRQSTTVPKVSNTNALGVTVGPGIAKIGQTSIVAPTTPAILRNCLRFISGSGLYTLQAPYALLGTRHAVVLRPFDSFRYTAARTQQKRSRRDHDEGANAWMDQFCSRRFRRYND